MRDFFLRNFGRLFAVLGCSTLVTACYGVPYDNFHASVSGSVLDADSADPIEGSKAITFEVVQKDGTSKEHTVKTDSSKNLRQALENAGLISGEEGAYGLYVKVVDGVTADYDVDGSYWSLTKNGVLCSGVDSTEIADGDHFEFTYTK
jgi:hypothetical protein